MNLLLKTLKIWCVALVLCCLASASVNAQGCTILVPDTLVCGTSGIEIPVTPAEVNRAFEIDSYTSAGWAAITLNATSTGFIVDIPSVSGTMVLNVETVYLDTGADRETCVAVATSCTVAPVCDLAITTDTTGITCDDNGAAVGEATVTVSGSSTYDILWSNNATTATITGLAAGTYDVTVTDTANSSCSETAQVTITEEANCCDLSITTSTVDITCDDNGAAVGEASIDLGSTSRTYDILWSTGAITETITGLAAGTYDVTVTDTANATCTETVSVIITEETGCVADCSCVDTNIPNYMYLGEFNGHAYYKRTTGDVEYWTALNYANDLGGYLVTINSAAENAFVNNATNGYIWLGLNDVNSEGNFIWTNGEPFTYDNWDIDQPNNWNNNQDYVRMRPNGKWNDLSDNDYSWAVIEVPCDCSGTTPTGCSGSSILFVAETPLTSGDVTLKTHLMSEGYVVTVIDEHQVNSSSANGYDLVFIGSTVLSGNIGNTFTHTTVPVVVSEAFLFDDMKMASDWGTYSATSQMVITDPSHPIAAGCSGTEEIYTSNQEINWGCPSSSAYKIGIRNNSSTKYMLFAYETGTSMVGLTAPARRVAMPMRDHTANYFTTKGWTIFDAAIEWALNCNGSTPPPAPTGCTNPTNIALNGTAYQSSVYYNSPAHLAIDGNTNGASNGGSITRTYYECNAYWELDLGCIADVDEIKVWNRSDSYSYMLDDYYVLVSEFPFSGSLNTILNDPNVWHTYESSEAGRPTTITVGETARYICVMLAGCNHLSIAEVEVFGCCGGGSGGSKTATTANLGNILAGKIEMDKDTEGNTLAINKVYPTPATDFATVDFMIQEATTTQINVYNIAGQKVIGETTETTIGTNSFKVDVSNLPSGTYLLEVLNGENRSVEKLFVNN